MTVTPWGDIGYITYKRTYARKLKDTSEQTEEFEDTVNRAIKACQTQLKVGFSTQEEERFKELLLSLKGSLAGRFWWQLGTKTVDNLGLASLQNCASTVVNEPIRPFTWAMDMLMLGSGVGYNIQREYVYELPKARKAKIVRQDTKDADFIVPDTRQGWVELLERTLTSHFITGKGFSYSTICIRGKGTSIKGFGGVASGPEELCWGINEISKILNSRAGKKVRPIDCLDIMNIIGAVVVAGNVRRSAQIAIGDMDDLQFLNAKRWDLGNIPNWRAMSNNSVVCNDFSLLPTQFWEGYKGNGEPYGIINLNLARKIGRIGEIEYPDSGVVGFNPCCFSIDSKVNVLTKTGYKEIKQITNQDNIWIDDKKTWANTNGYFKAGEQDVYKISMYNGEEFELTNNHKLMTVKDKRIGTRTTKVYDSLVEVKDLKLNDKIALQCSDVSTQINFGINGNRNEGAILGWLTGDGWLTFKETDRYPRMGLGFWEQEHDVANIIKKALRDEGVDVKISNIKNETKNIKRISNTTFVDLFTNKYQTNIWNFKHRYNPFLETASKEFLQGFLSAYFTADGTVATGYKNSNYNIQITSIDKELLLQVKNLLLYFGITSGFTCSKKAGRATFRSKEYLTKPLYKLSITSKINLERFQEHIGFLSKIKKEKLQFAIDCIKYNSEENLKYTSIKSITFLGKKEVGCIEVPEYRYFTANSIISGNSEQPLYEKETCCLAEVYLPNITNENELKDVVTYLYRVCKHSLTLPCHHPETEAIVHKNMRMGIGITGYLQSTQEQKSWLSNTYKYLREYDVKYSAEHGWPTSIKLTTVKPSGTLSLLAGVTPGAHPGYSEYFIRRIRMSSISPLVNICRNHGYDVEFQKNFDGTVDTNTVVVSFPCKFPKHTVFAKDMTAVDQLNVIKELQQNWSDNAVSCTIYYKKEELDSIKDWLSKNYNDNIKAVSFLLHNEHGFLQAPLEEITEEQYNIMKSKTKPIISCEVNENDIKDSFECEGGVCPIK